jgi:hypothetical protein
MVEDRVLIGFEPVVVHKGAVRAVYIPDIRLSLAEGDNRMKFGHLFIQDDDRVVFIPAYAEGLVGELLAFVMRLKTGHSPGMDDRAFSDHKVIIRILKYGLFFERIGSHHTYAPTGLMLHDRVCACRFQLKIDIFCRMIYTSGRVRMSVWEH